MKRIFIALNVNAGDTLIKMIDSFKSELKTDKINWTIPLNIHITLAFLGDTEDEVINEICSMLIDKCAGTGKFELILKGAGVFKNLKDPRIIWTGIGPSNELMTLYDRVISGLELLKIQIENRPFNPHLTLGRIKHHTEKEALKKILDQYHDTVLQKFPVDEVILFQSVLLQTGPVYTPIQRISL